MTWCCSNAVLMNWHSMSGLPIRAQNAPERHKRQQPQIQTAGHENTQDVEFRTEAVQERNLRFLNPVRNCYPVYGVFPNFLSFMTVPKTALSNFWIPPDQAGVQKLSGVIFCFSASGLTGDRSWQANCNSKISETDAAPDCHAGESRYDSQSESAA